MAEFSKNLLELLKIFSLEFLEVHAFIEVFFTKIIVLQSVWSSIAKSDIFGPYDD